MPANIDTQRLVDHEVLDDEDDGNTTGRDGVVDIPSDESGTNDQPIVFTSQIAAFLITINVTIGAGVLAMPSSMNEAGIIASLALQLPFLIGVIVTLIMCTELTVKTKVNSYHSLVEAHCHRYLYTLTQIALRLIVFGTVVAFMVIIGDQSDSFLVSVYREEYCKHPWYLNRNFFMILSTFLFIIPLCSAKTVDFLKYASFLGVLSIGFIVYMVFDQCLKQYNKGVPNKDGHWWADGVNFWPAEGKWFNGALILPVYCLAYQCHLSWVPTAATIKRKEKYTSYKTISIAMVVASIIYSGVCIMAILACGKDVEKDLTASFMGPRKNWIVETTIAIVALKCIFTLPPAFLPARMSFLEFMRAKFSWFANLSEPVQRIGLTSAIMLNALALSLISKKIQAAVEVLGCLCVLFIFPLPAISYLNLVDENRRMKQQMAGDDSASLKYTAKDHVKRYLSFFFIGFGFLMMLLVLYTSITDIINNWGAEELDPCSSKYELIQKHKILAYYGNKTQEL